ncbi:hypothetical protein ACNSOP_09200 [Aliarcobacter lanthieri]|uniref:hypothetical protein n=1 Tax=Aliarcobacter lanthieri TaxID=1355374 RepID=UPI003AAD609C
MILDLFVSVIKADTKDYEAGAKKVEKSTDEIAESMKNAEKQAQETIGKFKKFIKGAIGFLGTVAVAGKNVGIAISQADKINSLKDTADTISTTTSNLNAFNILMAESGAEAESSTDALRNLFKSTGEAISDTESQQAKLFKQLGVSLNNADGSIKDTTTLMGDLAGTLSDVDSRERYSIFEKLGISDPKVISGIVKHGKTLKENLKIYAELHKITKKQEEVAGQYKLANDRLNLSLEQSKLSIMEYIAPAITWLIDKFTIVVDWMNNHQAFVIGFFGTIAAVISTLYLPAMIKAGIATMVAMAPIIVLATKIGLLATAISLVVDDIYTFIEGGDSLTGRIIEWFKQFGNFSWDSFLESWSESMDKMAQPFIVLGNLISKTFTNMKNSVSENFNAIKEFIAGLLETVFGTIDKIKSHFNNIKSFLGLGGKVEITEENVSKKANNNTVKGSLADVLNETNKDIELANNTLATAEANPLNKTSSQQISNMSNSKNEQNIGIGEINVNTQATNSKEISSDIKSDLESQLQNLQAESYSGIDI